MNNIIILGKIVKKSYIHFDYNNKLKSYFKIYISENNNIFKCIILEKELGIDIIDLWYKKYSVNDIICVCGKIILYKDKYLVLCEKIYKA